MLRVIPTQSTPSKIKARSSLAGIAVSFALIASTIAVGAPSLASAQCAPDNPETSDRERRETSISETGTEFFVGELLAAIAGNSPTTQNCNPPDFDPFQDFLPQYDQPMELGLWNAQAALWGTITQDFPGGTFNWDGTAEALYAFSIDEDTNAEGEWNFSGGGIGIGTASSGGYVVDQHFTGSGPVTGTASLLILNGISTTTGTLTILGTTRSIDSPAVTNEPSRVQVHAAACDEAYGDWVYSIRANAEGAGFTTDLDGTWAAFRDNEAGAELARAEYTGGVSEQARTAFGDTANYIATYNQFVDDFQHWDTPSVFNFMEAVERSLNIFRNFTECDIEFFGQDNVTTAINALLFLMQGVLYLSDAVDQPLTGGEFRELLHVAVRTGAIGAGAPNPAQALKAEQGLIDAAERLLGNNLDPSDNQIFVNEDTKEAMRLGALMGWTYTVDGYNFPAKAVYAEYQAALGETGGE